MSTALLDDILSRQPGAPEIIHEEHDPSKINFVRGLSDPGEMIRCGYMPEIRRRAGEGDEAYQARIGPIVMALPQHERDKIMQAALRRAGLDLSNGRVNAVYANTLPWTGLGTVVRGEMNSLVALDKSGMDFTVRKQPLFYLDRDMKYVQDPGSWALVRTDTGARVGSAGSGYRVIQNRDAFAAIDTLLAQYGATYESAGSLAGGAKVWMLVNMPKQAFTVNGTGDHHEPYCCFFNGHTGSSGAAWFYPTVRRVECENTLTLSLRDRKKGISISHRGSIKGKLDAARDALGMAAESFETYHEQAEVLYKKPADIQVFGNELLDLVLDVSAAQALAGSDALAAAIAETQTVLDLDALRRKCQRRIEHRTEVLDDIITRYHSKTCDGIRDTAYGVFNAVTEYADHNTLGRYNKTDTYEQKANRFQSAMTGAGNEIKQAALQHALAM